MAHIFGGSCFGTNVPVSASSPTTASAISFNDRYRPKNSLASRPHRCNGPLSPICCFLPCLQHTASPRFHPTASRHGFPAPISSTVSLYLFCLCSWLRDPRPCTRCWRFYRIDKPPTCSRTGWLRTLVRDVRNGGVCLCGGGRLIKLKGRCCVEG